MKTWLKDHLIAAGHMTETGATRRARVRACTCGADIIVGLDGDRLAFEARVDPYPLSGFGEVLALLEGRYTWAAHAEAGRYVLEPRDSHAISARPAGECREDVMRQHRCHSPEPAGVTASAFKATPKPAPTDVPPF